MWPCGCSLWGFLLLFFFFFFSYFVLFVFIVMLVGPVWYCDDLQLLGKRELATLLFSDRLYSVIVALLDIFKIILPLS